MKKLKKIIFISYNTVIINSHVVANKSVNFP